MSRLFDVFSREDSRRSATTSRPTKARRRRESARMQTEQLERRAMLAITPSFDPLTGVLTISYDAEANQQATIEIERYPVAAPSPTTRVNLYATSNPTAAVFTGVSQINVTVPNYNDPGVNNNSLTIKGLGGADGRTGDRIIIGGTSCDCLEGGQIKQTAAGRWSDQTTDELQVLFTLEGIDDITVTAGGVINVSGAFLNDTGDASIRAIGQIVEGAENQHTATITVGETTPFGDILPHPELVSNYIQVVGAELDIYADIVASDEVILHAGDSAAERSNLVLPHDITVTGNAQTGEGRLDLFSTRSIIQLQGSTIVSPHVVAVSHQPRATGPDGPWMIDLGSEGNDFDTIALGMTAEPSDDPNPATEGRIGIRDIDDLRVSDFGILAATGQVRIDVGGALVFASPIQATGLIAESDHSIESLAGATMRLGVLGIDLLANDTFDPTATGDITLAGPITIDELDAAGLRDTTLVHNKIVAASSITLSTQFYSPLAGSTTFSGKTGVTVAGPIQVGSTQLNADSTAFTVFDHDLMLISHAGGITILDVPGGDAIPRTIQATNIISMDAAETIEIGGTVFAGTLYGNPLALPETDALPAITIIGDADVIVTETGGLQTSSYENDADTYPNPLVGRISVKAETQFDMRGYVTADGPLDVTSTGDVYLYGPVTTRESIDIETTQGSIDVQGAVRATGYSYTTTLPGPLDEKRMPNVILAAPTGSITTSALGMLRAGTVIGGPEAIHGEVNLLAQQGIVIGADIDTDGGVVARVTLGSFDLDALLRAGNDESVAIEAATGITELEFGRIHTSLLDVMITEGTAAADILLPALGNRVEAIQARNNTAGGAFTLATDSLLDVQRVETLGEVEITAKGTVGITGLTQSTGGSIAITSQGGGLNVQSTVLAPAGGISLSATGQIVQRGGNVTTIYLLSGGRDYSYAIVTLDPPPGAGDVALARAEITPYPTPPFGEGDGVTGFISDIIILNGGWGYPSGSRVGITIDGDGEGATAVAETSIVTSSIEARDDVSLSAGDGVTLVSAVRSAAGSVDVTATLGDVSVQSITAGAGVAVTANRGEITLVTVSAQDDVTLAADQGVRVNDSLNSFAGDIAITTTNGELEFDTDALTGPGLDGIIYAAAGGVTLTSTNGGIVTPYTINARGDVSLTSFNALELMNEITSQAGDIVATATSGRIELAANLVAEAGSITLEAQTSLVQKSLTGVTEIELLSSGQVTDQAPTVTVTVAAPAAGGGRPATAAAIIERRTVAGNFDDNDREEYFIGSIVVLDPGQGYAVGEQPLVTITGVAGAVARAFGPNALQMMMAQGDITLDAGEDVVLVNKVHSVAGDVLIATKVGDLDLSVDSSLVSASGGGITVTTQRGGAVIQRLAGFGAVVVDVHRRVTVEGSLYSDQGGISITSGNDAADVRDLNAGGDITITSFMSGQLGGEITSRGGEIAVMSGSGGIFLNANVVAEEGAITLAPQTFLLQQDGTGIDAVEILDRGGIILAPNAEPPDVLITIAPPADPRGEQAQAVAILGSRALGSDDVEDSVEWYIESVRIINPGRGYALGEDPITSVEGIGDAVLQAIGPRNLRNLSAETGITITAGNDVTLLYEATTAGGDISIVSTLGDLVLGADAMLLQALAGSVVLESMCGTVEVQRICVEDDVVIDGEAGVTVLTSIDAGGAITITSAIGVIDLNGEIVAEGGDITLASSSSGLDLAANVNAIAGTVNVTVHGGVNQASGTGLRRIAVINGGESPTDQIPSVTVSVAGPENGGKPATAYAELRSFTNLAGELRYTIDAIVITDPGQGYEIGEAPNVTISGDIENASALAVGPNGYQNVTAAQGIRIAAGETVTLRNTFRATAGDIVVSTIDGDIDASSATAFLHAEDGSVLLDSDCKDVTVSEICVAEDVIIRADGGVTVLKSIVAGGRIEIVANIRDAELNGEIYAETGSIVVTSRTADIALSANIHAETESVLMTANGGLTQTVASGLSGVTVLYGGESDGNTPPRVTVEIASPQRGGIAATAFARLRAFVNAAGQLRYTIESVELTSPGNGYFVGEIPEVTIRGINGAAAIANGPDGYQNIVAGQDVGLASGEDLLIRNVVRADRGSIDITSVGGFVDLSAITVQLLALQGRVAVTAAAQGVEVYRANAGTGVEIAGEARATVGEEIVAETGDIVITSGSGWIFTTANLNAKAGSIALDAAGGVLQSSTTGIEQVRVLSQGTEVSDDAPVVSIVIAPPRGGGLAATAQAIVSQVGTVDQGGGNVDLQWAITNIVITNPGRGYAVGESPLVTIIGMRGASAVAIGPTGFQDIIAETDVEVRAGNDVTLVNTVRATTGRITISSIDGSLFLGDSTLFLHAPEGQILLDSDCMDVEVQQACAAGDIVITAGGGVELVKELSSDAGSITVSAGNFVFLQGVVQSDGGNISVASAAESVSLDAVLLAPLGSIMIAAGSEVVQQVASGIAQADLLASGGVFEDNPEPPVVTVTVAPPSGGGRPARVEAILGVTEIPDGLGNSDYQYFIERLEIIDPGEGYAVGETPLVTIQGMPGASARVFGPTGVKSITAGVDFTAQAIEDVTLVNTITTLTGDILIVSVSGSLGLAYRTLFLHAEGGGITLRSDCEDVVVNKACAAQDVLIEAGDSFELISELESSSGDIRVAASNLVLVAGVVYAAAGDIAIESRAESVSLNGVLTAPEGAISVEAGGQIRQGTSTGLSSVQLVAAGAVFEDNPEPPVVTITVAAPSGGGRAADIQAVIGVIEIPSAFGTDYQYFIERLELVDPGEGYSVGETPLVTIIGMPGAIARAIGPTGSGAVLANAGISFLAVEDVTLVNLFTATGGDIVITSISGNLDLAADTLFVHAEAGGVSLVSDCGTVAVERVCALNDVVIVGPLGVTVEAQAKSDSGAIVVNADAGRVTMPDRLGTLMVTIVTGGAGYDETTTVEIAEPAAGGVAAIGRPIIENVNGVVGVITGVQILYPGVGYLPGEVIDVTFSGGGAGATAFAMLRDAMAVLDADGDISVNAGSGVVVENAINSHNGDLAIRTLNGDLDFGHPNAIISAENGSVTLISVNGQIINPPVLQVTGGVSMSSFQNLNVVAPITANVGGITLESTGGAVTIGTPAVAANLLADGRVTLNARNGVTQPNGFIRGTELLVTNRTNAAVTLGNPLNNVDNVSILNLGSVTYVDADDFETGLNRTAPLGVEVAGDAVSLSSVAPYSTVRVVSGLSYRTLAIAAGTQSGTTVGTVEFVTTTEGDNTNLSPFAGTLRDMIRYARSNEAAYTVDGSQRRQPMALVFDEDDFPVEEITVSGNIPVINVPLRVLGSRLEQSVLAAGVERVGIQGTPLVKRGLTFGRGSEQSLVESVAMHGFSQGTSLFVVSGSNTFQNLRVGMNDAGVPNANRIGMLLTSPTSVNNLVGGLELDDATENVFVANRGAGIFIDAGASGNRIFGNVIGDADGTRADFANGDGVRIRASSGNLIGAAESGVSPYAMGNVIAGNNSSGVLVLDANSGTSARANKIQNNLIERNRGLARPNVGSGAGVLVVGSSFVDIGGASGLGNTFLRQGMGTTEPVDGVRIVDSASIRVLGNAVGVDVETQTTAGNTGSGISIAESSNVEVSGRNTIGGNGGDGITIANASTGVQVTNNLVGLFSTGERAGNARDGIYINAAVGNTIGARNRIAYNRNGVSVADGRADTLAAGNKVFGSEMFANLEAGVRLVGGSGTTVGSLTAANANLIRNNAGDGVRIEWSAVSGAASGHAIQGNYIGTDRNAGVNGFGNGGAGIVVSGGTGNTIANGNVVMNNAGAGVELRGGSGNTVGGTTAAAANRIMNNAGSGVVLGSALGTPSTLRDAKDQSVMGNVIRDNGGHGIEARAGTAGATIGQKVTTSGVSGMSNTIHGNAGYGVSVAAGAQRVSTQGNAIFENLMGAMAVASGANRSAAQSISLTSAEIRQPSGGGEQLVVRGTLANGGYAQQQYSVDIYASLPDEGDYLSLTGYQARRFLGRATVTTNAQGVATFELKITSPIEVGEVIVATATALRFESGSSSVMSNAVTADYPGIPTPRY